MKMLSFRLKTTASDRNGILESQLYDQNSFYNKFLKDLCNARKEILIESPFISPRRLEQILPILQKASNRGIMIIVNTKHPNELDIEQRYQAEQGIIKLQDIGTIVLFTGGHHRKLAIIDRRFLYEGSLNILSQNDSCEIMRRIVSKQASMQMIEFIGIGKCI